MKNGKTQTRVPYLPSEKGNSLKLPPYTPPLPSYLRWKPFALKLIALKPTPIKQWPHCTVAFQTCPLSYTRLVRTVIFSKSAANQRLSLRLKKNVPAGSGQTSCMHDARVLRWRWSTRQAAQPNHAWKRYGYVSALVGYSRAACANSHWTCCWQVRNSF